MVSDEQADGDEQGQLTLKDRFASPAKSMSVVVAAIIKFWVTQQKILLRRVNGLTAPKVSSVRQ